MEQRIGKSLSPALAAGSPAVGLRGASGPFQSHHAPHVGANADVNQAPTFDCPTIGCCCTSPRNAFKVICALGT